MTQFKQTNTGERVVYKPLSENGFELDLNGATAEFYMMKNGQTYVNAPAYVENQSLVYDFTEQDTLYPGVYAGEFKVVYQDGTVKHYPEKGFLSIKIDKILNPDASTVGEERVALQVSLVEDFKAEVNAKLVGVEDATLAANDAATHATTQGDYAKAEADRLVGTDVSVLDNRVTQLDAQLADTSKKVHSKESKQVRPLISFYLDDGYENDYTIVYPKTKPLNIPVTICLHNNSYLTLNTAKLNELVSNGWEVHAHTEIDQDLDALSYEQQYQTMKNNKDLLESLGYQVDGLCYPRGRSNADTLKATRALFNVGMSSSQGMNTTPIDTYYVKRILTDSYDMASMKALVDKIKTENKGWIVFYSHSNIFHTNTTVRDRYFEMLDYVAASGVETVTVKDAMKVYTNTLDIGDIPYSPDFLKVGSDGVIDFSNMPMFVDKKNATINSRLGTDFKAGRVSVNKFPLSTPSDIPFDSGVGVLYTDRTFETYGLAGTRAIQRFEGVNGTIVTRNYNSGTTGWTDWVNIGVLNTRKTKAYTNDSPITDFPQYKVTKVTFISSDAAGLPDGGIGTLETNRLSGNDILNYQMYYPYNKNYFYKRNWTASGWASWVKFSAVITHSETYDFGTVNAGATAVPTFTITGVTIDDVVTVNFPYGVANGVIPFAYISAADTVIVKLTNVTANNVVVGSRPLRFAINKV